MASEKPPQETVAQRLAVEPSPTGYGRRARLDWAQRGGNRSVVIDQLSVIGSAPTVAVVIDDPTVSRLHVEIDPRDDGVWVRDLGSKNGTLVQGLRIESARVPHLGRIRIGGTDLVLTYGPGTKPHDEWPEDRFGPLVGKSRPMRELFARLAKVAAAGAPALVTGETGTGKELVARAIHEASARSAGPFIVVDCAALPETLLDAELFGHAKGAFTGAVGARAGAIEAAAGGTVFLDEIGELPRSMQPKLLRVLEAKTVRRLGETAHRSVDVRFVSATHRDLLTMVSAGDFREDLYFRLAVLPVRVAPLRERADDFEALLRHFAAASASLVTPELIAAVSAQPWRGNVRELRNFVERAKALGVSEALSSLAATAADTGTIEPTGEPQTAATATAAAAADVETAPGEAPRSPPPFTQPYRVFRDAWQEYGDSAYVRELLARHDQNVAAAAREAEIDRTYLYKLIRRYFR